MEPIWSYPGLKIVDIAMSIRNVIGPMADTIENICKLTLTFPTLCILFPQFIVDAIKPWHHNMNGITKQVNIYIYVSNYID